MRGFVVVVVLVVCCAFNHTAAAFTPSAKLPNDLCEIPFTEVHRAALENEHLPNLRKVIGFWHQQGPKNSRIGRFDRRGEFDYRVLDSFSLKIKTAATGEAKVSYGGLPERHGPQYPPSVFDHPDGPYAIVFDDEQQRASDAALQALLHWACYTGDGQVFQDIHLFVSDYRGDDYRNSDSSYYPLTFEDWQQLVNTIYSAINANRIPENGTNAVRTDTVVDIVRWLLTTVYDPAWSDEQKKREYRGKLRMDVAEWVLGRGTDFGTKSHHIVDYLLYDLVSFPSQEYRPLDSMDLKLFEKLMAVYKEFYYAEMVNEGFSPRKRYNIDRNLARIAMALDLLEVSSCFLADLRKIIETPDFDEVDRTNSIRLQYEYDSKIGKTSPISKGMSYPCLP